MGRNRKVKASKKDTPMSEESEGERRAKKKKTKTKPKTCIEKIGAEPMSRRRGLKYKRKKDRWGEGGKRTGEVGLS